MIILSLDLLFFFTILIGSTTSYTGGNDRSYCFEEVISNPLSKDVSE